MEDILAADAAAAEGAERAISDDRLASVAGGRCFCLTICAIKLCGCFVTGISDNKSKSLICPLAAGIRGFGASE